jgi:GNAT superfamily N-acetyltransferase
MAQFLGGGGAISDVMGAVRGPDVVGFALLFHPESPVLGPSIAWGAPRGAPAGGLGPMGLAPACRGRGLGIALVDRAMVHLASRGVHEMMIDWTILLEFYGRLGFTPCRRYRHAERSL